MVTLYESHLYVQTHVFVQVPRGFMLFRPISGSDFKDPFHTVSYHCLLVELGRLRQVDFPVEVLDLEQAGPTLGAAADEFAALDLGKIAAAHVIAEIAENIRLQIEDGSDFRIAQTEHPVIEQGIDAELVGVLVDCNR